MDDTFMVTLLLSVSSVSLVLSFIFGALSRKRSRHMSQLMFLTVVIVSFAAHVWFLLLPFGSFRLFSRLVAQVTSLATHLIGFLRL